VTATTTRAGTSQAWWVAGACAVAAVLCQMVFPFTDGGTPTLTIVAVLLFAAASLASAWAVGGPASALVLLVVAGGGGLLAEAVGVHTGFPFGSYAYTGTLGPQLVGVPVVVPVAWVMMSYPALLVGRRLAGACSAAVLVGAWALASWDVFLDPQMVDAGHWRWAHPDPGLPGVDGVPLTNFAGWLLVSLLLVGALGAALDRVAPGRHHPAGSGPCDRLPGALYLWTYASSVLAHTAFFGRPPVALVGGLLMGLVAVPYALAYARAVRGSAGSER
jgi:carotene biosynthesis associated membrane protein